MFYDRTGITAFAGTLPLVANANEGVGVGKIFKLGNQAINSRLEAYYNLEQPDAVPDWNMAFTFQFLFPK